jgi:hypothetical protein
LNKPNVGLFIPTGIWRELQNFSSGAVCLVLASDVFKEEDYIRDFDDFLKNETFIHCLNINNERCTESFQ